MSESEIQEQIEEYLQYQENMGKLMYLRINSGMAFVGSGKKKYAIRLAKEGTADLLVIQQANIPAYPTHVYVKAPRVTWIEVKDTDGKQSEAQKEFEAEVVAQGCEYFIVRSLEEATEIIPQ